MSSESEETTSGPSIAPSFSNEIFTAQYRVLKALGHGGLAKVVLAQHRLMGAPVAVKVLEKEEKWCHPIVSEVEIMKMIHHPNIVSLLQIIESEKFIYMIMELAEGVQLFQRIREDGCLPEHEARGIFHQILDAMQYCHKLGIVHRDLKPDNIMVDPTGKVTIIDFGLGTRFKPGQKLERLCGAFQFISPEIFLAVPYDGQKADIWSLGILLYYMVTGMVPFAGDTLRKLQEQVTHGRYFIPYHLSREIRSIISRLLTINPRHRPTVQDIMGHEWLLLDGNNFIHSDDTESICPDPATVAAMALIGFNAKDTCQSVLQRKFDEAMACYYLLQWQARRGDACLAPRKAWHPGATPFPSLTDPVAFPLPPRRRASEPSLTTWQASVDLGLQKERGIPVCDAQKRTCTPTTACQRAMTAPCIITSAISRGDMEDSTLTDISLSEEKSLPGGPGDGGTEVSRHNQYRSWQVWPRMGTFLRRLCCLLPSKNPQRFQKRMSPTK